jgi:hypothetical protein
MKPIDFKDSNHKFAEKQKEYITLPGYMDENGIFISCWKLTFFERIIVLLKGKIFLSTMTFFKPLQPQRMSVKFEEEI